MHGAAQLPVRRVKRDPRMRDATGDSARRAPPRARPPRGFFPGPAKCISERAWGRPPFRPLRRLQLFLPKPQGAGRGRDRRCPEPRGASAERRARRLRGPHPARSPAPWPCRCFLHQREREALGGPRRRSPSRGQQVAGPRRAPQVGTLVTVPDVCLGVKKGRAPLRTPPEGASVRRLLTGGRGRGRDASQGLGTGPPSLRRRKPRASCHRAVLGTRQLLALREVSAASASAPRARPAVAPEAEVAEMRPRPAWRRVRGICSIYSFPHACACARPGTSPRTGRRRPASRPRLSPAAGLTRVLALPGALPTPPPQCRSVAPPPPPLGDVFPLLTHLLKLFNSNAFNRSVAFALGVRWGQRGKARSASGARSARGALALARCDPAQRCARPRPRPPHPASGEWARAVPDCRQARERVRPHLAPGDARQTSLTEILEAPALSDAFCVPAPLASGTPRPGAPSTPPCQGLQHHDTDDVTRPRSLGSEVAVSAHLLGAGGGAALGTVPGPCPLRRAAGPAPPGGGGCGAVSSGCSLWAATLGT